MSDHRWAVDAIENGIARVEEDGTRMISVPVSVLPPGVKEGQVLKVRRAPGSANDAAPVSVVVDEAATRGALDASRRQTAAAMRESAKRDPGGDVSL